MTPFEQEASARYRLAQHEINLQALRSHRLHSQTRPGTLRRVGYWLWDHVTATLGIHGRRPLPAKTRFKLRSRKVTNRG